MIEVVLLYLSVTQSIYMWALGRMVRDPHTEWGLVTILGAVGGFAFWPLYFPSIAADIIFDLTNGKEIE